MAKIRLASPLQFDSIVDGPGIRCVLWTQGCVHACPGCHNPQTHDRQAGTLTDIDEIINDMKASKLQSGITLSGGEPFLQSVELIPICEAAKQLGWNIWAFTGFKIEELMKKEETLSLLNYLDVLVDGKFVEAEKDYRLKFKGSKNQRIIDVPASLSTSQVVLSTYDDKNLNLD